MTSRRTRTSSSLAAKLVELSIAAPQVVAHRVARMAVAGHSISPRDKKEFEQMIAEKKVAFTQSWAALALQSARANQAFASSIFASMWLPARHRPSAATLVSRYQRAAIEVLNKGVAPVHGKAVANAKRLARTKLR